MTCEETRAVIAKPDPTVAEYSAAADHFFDCDACQEWVTKTIDDCLAVVAPEDAAKAAAKGMAAGKRMAERAMQDPEA